jgi:uncharacterized RDD family membrane protein YckC
MHHAASAAGLPAAQGLRNGGVARRLAFGLFFTHLRVELPDGTRLRPASRGGRTAMAIDIKPHAYDPVMNPELFEGVLSRRILAFVIDLVILAIPVVLASIFIFAFGIVTLGLGFFLYGLLYPATVIWALVYFGVTLGGPSSATVGMRVVDLEMRTWYGAPAYFLLGAVHAIVFWVSITVLSPFIVLVAFFNERRRLLHDILLGTVVINNARRAAMLRAGMMGAAPYRDAL